MENLKKILKRLQNGINIEELVIQRKKECIEENKRISKQSPQQFNKEGEKRPIGTNRMTGIKYGNRISASSDFIEEDREVVIQQGMGDNCSIITGNLDETYYKLFEKLKSEESIDINKIVQIVYDTVNEYFGTKGDVNRVSFLRKIDEGIDTLSVLKGRNLAACVERALLSQNLFKILGIDSTMKSSSIINKGKEENHSYNIIRVNRKNYIYDSALSKKVENEKKEPIVGQISDEEYMLMLDGRQRYGCKTQQMDNEIVYDSSFGLLEEELSKLSQDEIDNFRKQAKLENIKNNIEEATINECGKIIRPNNTENFTSSEIGKATINTPIQAKKEAGRVEEENTKDKNKEEVSFDDN